MTLGAPDVRLEENGEEERLGGGDVDRL